MGSTTFNSPDCVFWDIDDIIDKSTHNKDEMLPGTNLVIETANSARRSDGGYKKVNIHTLAHTNTNTIHGHLCHKGERIVGREIMVILSICLVDFPYPS